MYPHLKAAPQSEAEWFQALTELARYLRSPKGCPWDREQQAQNFARYALEECQELVEGFEQGVNDKIAEEWGDVFFVLLATAVAAEQEGRFTVREALEAAHAKMIRRHEHVFGDQKAATPEEAIARWNTVKAKERGEDVPANEGK